jgi:uncharacterized protein (TIGR04255 family)
VREAYPILEEKPPLPEVYENPVSSELGRTELSALPPVRRSWFVDPTRAWILQLQENRLAHNWRQIDDAPYPRFPVCWGKLEAAWGSFLELHRAERLAEPVVDQLELTYVNRLLSGSAWSRLEELGKVLPDLSWRPGKLFLPGPSAFEWSAAFEMPEAAGRLRVSARPAVWTRDGRPVLLVELTARGPLAPRQDMHDWFGLAREWIVRGFADLADEAHQRSEWGRR